MAVLLMTIVVTLTSCINLSFCLMEKQEYYEEEQEDNYDEEYEEEDNYDEEYEEEEQDDSAYENRPGMLYLRILMVMVITLCIVLLSTFAVFIFACPFT